MRMSFTKNYPLVPPHCVFEPVFTHPKVEPNGQFSLEMLENWMPWFTIKGILLAAQDMLFMGLKPATKKLLDTTSSAGTYFN